MRLNLETVLLSAAAVLLFSPEPATARQAQTCKCTPEITLDPDESGNCCCTEIVITNLTTSRSGKCTNSLGTCSPPSTLTCKVIGTFSETSCEPGVCTSPYEDEPFTIEKACLPSSDGTESVSFVCSVSSPEFVHVIQLTCKRCILQQ